MGTEEGREKKVEEGEEQTLRRLSNAGFFEPLPM